MKIWYVVSAAFLFFSYGYTEEYLISVTDLPPRSRSDVRVIEAVKNISLILGGEKTLRYLSGRRLQYTILDKNPLQKKGAYYLVTPVAESVQTIRSAVSVLADYRHLVIVYVTPEQRDAFFGLRVEKALITFDPFIFNDDILQGLPDRPVRRDDGIKEIVDKVSNDSLRAYVRKLQSFDRLAASTDNKTKMVPWLEQKFKELGADSVYTQSVSGYGSNVIAILKGTTGNRTKYCLLGGHCDAVKKFAGADDNASGTAAALDAARVLSTHAFESDIRLAAFNAEEVGLNGSDEYAKAAKKKGDQIIGGVINFDMIGYGSSKPTLYVHYASSPAGNKAFSEFFKTTAAAYTDLTITLQSNSDFESASDQYCFWENGYAACLGIEAKDFGGLCPGYHTAADTLDSPTGLNSSELMTKSTRAAVAVLATLAKPIAASVLPKDTRKTEFVITAAQQGKTFCTRLTLTVLVDRAPVRVALYSPLGGRIAVLADGVYSRGTHTLAVPKARHAPGMYLIDVKSDGRRFAQPMLVH